MIPFIILGMPRTGSTLLATSIAQHPEVKIYGELFHELESERKQHHYVTKINNEVVYYLGGNNDAIDFLYKWVWNKYNLKYKAVGFKLFAQRVECKGTEKLFFRLKNEVNNLHIICIERKNLLDVYVSLVKAKQSKIWSIKKNELDKLKVYKNSVTPIHINPTVLEKFFKSYKTIYHFYPNFFKDMPFIKISYDELKSNFDQVMKLIFKFLKVEPIKVKPLLIKQNIQSHKNFILNYDELKSYFSGTEYEIFFVD